jgi:hypothetical protein
MDPDTAPSPVPPPPTHRRTPSLAPRRPTRRRQDDGEPGPTAAHETRHHRPTVAGVRGPTRETTGLGAPFAPRAHTPRACPVALRVAIREMDRAPETSRDFQVRQAQRNLRPAPAQPVRERPIKGPPMAESDVHGFSFRRYPWRARPCSFEKNCVHRLSVLLSPRGKPPVAPLSPLLQLRPSQP